MLIHDLQNLGFTKNQAVVYLALGELQPALAGVVIKKTGLHRQLVYAALASLEERRLIAKTQQRSGAVYRLLNPDRLLSDLKSKETLAQNVIEEMKLRQPPEHQEVVVYEGVADLRRKELEFFQHPPAGKDFCYLGLAASWPEVMGDDFARRLVALQKKNRLHIRGLAAKRYPDHAYAPMTEIRYVPELASLPASETQILPDRILIKLYVPPYSIVEIINREVARNYQDYFDYLWRKAK
jgi:DNA-binding MarR family transcriptional regulator